MKEEIKAEEVKEEEVDVKPVAKSEAQAEAGYIDTSDYLEGQKKATPPPAQGKIIIHLLIPHRRTSLLRVPIHPRPKVLDGFKMVH